MMKLTVNRNALLDALIAANKVTNSRQHSSILRCVVLSAVENMLTIKATDYEVSLSIDIDQVIVKSSGQVAVPASDLLLIVQKGEDETIDLDADKDSLHIRSSDSHFEIFTQSASGFPAIQEMNGGTKFVIDAPRLAAMIDSVSLFAAKENARFTVNSIYLDRDGLGTRLVATNGNRLAVATDAQSAGELCKALIFPRASKVLLGVLQHGNTSEVQVDKNRISAKCGGYTFVSALIDGSFPDYKTGIPIDSEFKVEIQAKKISDAVSRAAMLLSEEDASIILKFENDSVSLSSKSGERGEAKIIVAGIKYQGKPIEIKFNQTYLKEAFRGIKSEGVIFEFKDSRRPVLIRSTDVLYAIAPQYMA